MQPFFTKVRLLGRGTSGKAYLVQHSITQELFVVKKVPLENLPAEEKARVIKEVTIMRGLEHPNVVSLREVFTAKGKLCIGMEYANGTLEELIAQRKEPLSEYQVLSLLFQLAHALKYVHSRNVVHRDIKAQNVFLTTKGIVKLGDFGVSKSLASHSEMARTFIGTPCYLSPELVEGQPYSYKTDIWALGVLLYQLCCLRKPFIANSIPLLAIKIMRCAFEPIPEHYSPQLREIVYACLQHNPDERPDAADILLHPYMQDYYSLRQEIISQQLLPLTQAQPSPQTPQQPSLESEQPLSESLVLQTQTEEDLFEQFINSPASGPQPAQEPIPQPSGSKPVVQQVKAEQKAIQAPVSFTVEFTPCVKKKSALPKPKSTVTQPARRPQMPRPQKTKQQKQLEREQERKLMLQDIKERRKTKLTGQSNEDSQFFKNIGEKSRPSQSTIKSKSLFQSKKSVKSSAIKSTIKSRPGDQHKPWKKGTKCESFGVELVESGERAKGEPGPKPPKGQPQPSQIKQLSKEITDLVEKFKDFEEFDWQEQQQPQIEQFEEVCMEYIANGVSHSELSECLGGKLSPQQVKAGAEFMREWVAEHKGTSFSRQELEAAAGRENGWSQYAGELLALVLLEQVENQ